MKGYVAQHAAWYFGFTSSRVWNYAVSMFHFLMCSLNTDKSCLVFKSSVNIYMIWNGMLCPSLQVKNNDQDLEPWCRAWPITFPGPGETGHPHIMIPIKWLAVNVTSSYRSYQLVLKQSQRPYFDQSLCRGLSYSPGTYVQVGEREVSQLTGLSVCCLLTCSHISKCLTFLLLAGASVMFECDPPCTAKYKY